MGRWSAKGLHLLEGGFSLVNPGNMAAGGAVEGRLRGTVASAGRFSWSRERQCLGVSLGLFLLVYITAARIDESSQGKADTQDRCNQADHC